ncbi:MAG: dihydropyrimidinase [Oscillospiraceae bacterium]|nr:dihydropyrimidinase [Oscillospiraceae bacterium]
MKILLKGGFVVSSNGAKKADVLIDGEKIAKVGRNLTCSDASIINVADQLLFPGFIDAHTHFDLDVCNTTTADNFSTGSKAALRGGTTTVIDYACPNKGESLQHGLDQWHTKADGYTYCDYSFHMTIDDWNESIEKEIANMFAAGITSFKMYTTYSAMMISDGDMYLALKKLKKFGGICGVHCENSSVIDAKIAERKASGKMGVSSHAITRPDYLEAEAVARVLRIAQAADVPIIIVHLTSEAAMREVEIARKRGQKVYVETCPQYLLLDESVYFNEDYSSAARYVCAPPLRTDLDQRYLWKALHRDEIQTIATDHCSFTLAQKDAGKEDFTKIPGGLPGVETRGELIYSYGVTTRKISLGQMCSLLSENPARLYGLFPRKGIIRKGSDADIVVYDPRASHVIRAEDMVANVDYTPYEGFVTSGGISMVFLRGNLAVRNGKVVADRCGKYLVRGKNSLV